MAAAARTYLAFQHNAKLHTLKAIVTAIRPYSDLEEANRQLYKDGSDQDHVVVTGGASTSGSGRSIGGDRNRQVETASARMRSRD